MSHESIENDCNKTTHISLSQERASTSHTLYATVLSDMNLLNPAAVTQIITAIARRSFLESRIPSFEYESFVE
jgi:hypothetical protein